MDNYSSSIVNWGRVEAIGRLLSRVPPRVLLVIEENDPQFRAVKSIVEKYGYKSVAIVVANSVVSYRLSSRGEDYWVEFSRSIISADISSAGDIISFMSSFLPLSRGNRVLVKQKVSRLKKAFNVINSIYNNPQKYTDLYKLLLELSSALNSDIYSKTVVFSVKMAYYAYRCLSAKITNSSKIPVPIDKRISILTYTSGLIDYPPSLIISKYQVDASLAWMKVAQRAGIEPISMDALLWLPARGVDKALYSDIERARMIYVESLRRYSSFSIDEELAYEIARELFSRKPTLS